MTLAADIAQALAALLSGEQTEDQTRGRLIAIAGGVHGVRAQLTLANEVPPPDDHATARRLFDYWKKVCNHPNAKPDPTRLAKAMARLRDGFSEQELRWAIDGMAGSDFHSGANDAGKRFDDMELCFRNVRHAERFIEAARGRGLAGPREARDDQKAKLRADAQKAMRDGRTDDYNRFIRQLRET